MNKIYLYDDSFNNLMLLVFTLLHLNIKPDDIKSYEDYTESLINETVNLKLDSVSAHLLMKQIPYNVFKTCFYVYLSTNEKKELTIYYFIKNAIKYKNEIFYRRNLRCVNLALKLSKNVSREAHKLKGFLRFKEMENNFYYAEMVPTNNVISILANHFKKRFKNEHFIIKDVKRNIYAFYDTKKVYYLTNEDIIKLELDLSDKEVKFEELWKTFFNTISIKERKNLKAQMCFMPKKYWNYIVEMEEENESSN